MDYLTLPFTLKDGYLRRGTLHESIRDAVGLILSTRPGTVPFAPTFGCALWEREFSDLLSANRAEIRAALRNAIDAFERRLFNVSVSFTPDDRLKPSPLGLTVRVTGNYREGGEERKFTADYRLI